MLTLDGNDYHALLDKIRQDRGLDLSQYKENFIKRRLAVRLRARGVSTCGEYLRLLDEAEYPHLLDVLTVNLSYFFRDAPVFQEIKAAVLPQIVQAKSASGNRLIRVWSAGCAAGEEPYSLAMLLLDLLGSDRPRWQTHILATDIDEAMLGKARQGRYAPFSFKESHPGYLADYLSRYFAKEEDQFVIGPQVQEMVDFRRHDLFSHPMPRRCDLILCRNVLIYFTREQHERLFAAFHQALNEGGYLIIGKTEVMPPAATRLFSPVNLRERIYIKKGKEKETHGF